MNKLLLICVLTATFLAHGQSISDITHISVKFKDTIKVDLTDSNLRYSSRQEYMLSDDGLIYEGRIENFENFSGCGLKFFGDFKEKLKIKGTHLLKNQSDSDFFRKLYKSGTLHSITFSNKVGKREKGKAQLFEVFCDTGGDSGLDIEKIKAMADKANLEINFFSSLK